MASEEMSATTERQSKLVVDVRAPSEFREVHIPGSVNLPLGDISTWGPTLGNRCSSVTLVCHSGQRAERACAGLKGVGLEHVEILAGGIADWIAAGKDVTRGQGGVSLERQVRIVAGTLVLMATLLGAFVHPGFFALAGAVGAGLLFAGVSNTCMMGMLLMKLPYNRSKGGVSE